MRRVVMMVVDGLRGDMLTSRHVPAFAAHAAGARQFTRHRCAFPSATRVNSATLSTGCQPARHGLLGNVIALDEGEGLVPVSVGPPTFRERWRRATGRTLEVPTLAERLREHGGAVFHSNSSAGAAHMQDPDGHGTLFHRSGSHAPGLVPITDERHPAVGYDASGDAEITRRFCAALGARPAALDLLWICEPDHSQHALELGSPEHLTVLAGADRCIASVVDAVRTLRTRGEDVLFIICSDHGHESVTEVVPVERLMREAGLLDGLNDNDIVIASSGMGALIFTSRAGAGRVDGIARWLGDAPWCDAVHRGEGLAAVGLAPRDGLELAFAMAKQPGENRFGVSGLGAVALDAFAKDDVLGLGQHGGLGALECNPCLVIDGPGVAPGVDARTTHAVDLAPTVLGFLGVAGDGMDGRSLL